jgi:ferritin-like metal-binding protein YciE
MKEFCQLFATGIKNMHCAEKEIIAELPNFIEAAKEPKLKEALRDHLEETKIQLNRLEGIAEELGINVEEGTCNAMQAILKEGLQCIKADLPPEIKDVAIIAAAQCVEHFEIAVYGTLKTYACLLKEVDAEKMLKNSLEEESHADKKLSELANGTLFKKGINKKACDEECA